MFCKLVLKLMILKLACRVMVVCLYMLQRTLYDNPCFTFIFSTYSFINYYKLVSFVHKM